jgi:lysophospholipase L1-like esterase
MRWDPGAATRVLFMGDSFTEAVQVPFDASFVGRLAARAAPGTCLANAGVASYSPILYRLQWREKLRDLRPTHVVLQLFGNDARDDATYAAGAASLDAAGLPLAVPGPKERWYTPVWRASYLGYAVRRFSRVMAYKSQAKRGALVEAGAVMEENPEITPLTHRALLALRDEIASDGAELWIMPVTSRANALDEPATFGSHVRAWCETNGVRVVDLRPAFADPKPLFFTRDIHWNADGHEKVAEVLARSLPGFGSGN